MQNRLLYILLAVVAAILIVRASVFTVSEGQLAIKSIGGEIVDSNYKPGLHFRIPLVNEVSRYDAKILTQMYPSEHFLTREQEQLNVDFYVKWRILNLRKFYEATGGTEEVANARLGETVKDSIKSVVTQRTLQQVITAERAEFTASPRSTCRSRCRIQYSIACDPRSRPRLRSCAPRAWRRRNASGPKRTRHRPRFWRMQRAKQRRFAVRATRRRARCTPSRTRRMQSSTVSIAACSPTGKPWALRATCW
jgi:hypothetical protein